MVVHSRIRGFNDVGIHFCSTNFIKITLYIIFIWCKFQNIQFTISHWWNDLLSSFPTICVRHSCVQTQVSRGRDSDLVNSYCLLRWFHMNHHCTNWGFSDKIAETVLGQSNIITRASCCWTGNSNGLRILNEWTSITVMRHFSGKFWRKWWGAVESVVLQKWRVLQWVGLLWVRPLSFKLKNIIQHYSWENNVLKEQEEEEEELLPVWMIYWFTQLMGAAPALWNVGEWKLEQYFHNRGCDDGEITESHLNSSELEKSLWIFGRTRFQNNM